MWLRCKAADVSCEGKIIQAGDWRPIAAGQSLDMGLIPERSEIAKLFEDGKWDLLTDSLFSIWRRH